MIDWSKPIEATGDFDRADAKVLQVLKNDNALIYWTTHGAEYYAEFTPHSLEWRNVPELSKRDESLLFEGFMAGTRFGRSEGQRFIDWFADNAPRLARECPHD